MEGRPTENVIRGSMIRWGGGGGGLLINQKTNYSDINNCQTELSHLKDDVDDGAVDKSIRSSNQ